MVRLFVLFAIAVASLGALAFTPAKNSGLSVVQANNILAVDVVTKKPAGKAPDFTYKDGARSTSFAELTAGKVVVLNFWATWCGPCRKEIPDLIELHKEMAPKGVTVIGVSLDQADNRMALVKNFVEKSSIPYPNFIDNTEFKLAEAFGGIQSIPTTFIIDRKGNIVQRIVGAVSKTAFAEAVAKAL